MRRISVFIGLVLLAFFLIIFSYLFFIKKQSFSFEQLAKKENIIPIAVIGSGPAGLSA